MPEDADAGRRRLRADVTQIATADEGRMSAARADGAMAEAANETTTSKKPGDDPMNADEFAKTANALLAEGVALLRAHAGEGPAIERYVRHGREGAGAVPGGEGSAGRRACGRLVEVRPKRTAGRDRDRVGMEGRVRRRLRIVGLDN
jgi:hypothetical protein